MTGTLTNWVCVKINCRVIVYIGLTDGDKACPGCGNHGSKQHRPVLPR